jgi:hypothetical protein
MNTAQPPRRLPPFTSFLPFSILLMLVGWGGLVYLILFTLPTLGPRWLLFFFVSLGMTGTALPIVVFLNIRFASMPPIDSGGVIRQACWAGVYGGIIVWLQLGRILTPSMGMFIALGLIIIEGLIRMRERARWAPEGTPETAPTTIEEFHPPEDPEE